MNRNQDDKILGHLEEHFSCKICNGVLISAKAVDCGHIFCTYCLDLLQATIKNCPECSAPITSPVKAPSIDKEIDSLFDSCSPDLQRSHELAKTHRAEKIKDRAKAFKNIRKNLPHGSPANAKSARNLDDICTSLASNIATSVSPYGSLKSSRAPSNPNPGQLKTPRTGRAGPLPPLPPIGIPRKSKSRMRLGDSDLAHMLGISLSDGTLTQAEGTCDPKASSTNMAGIDLVKVEALFNMYDIFLKSETAPGGCGSGDMTEESADLADPEEINSASGPEIRSESEEIIRLKKKHQMEVEALLSEAEDVVGLDEFVKKWSDELRKIVKGGEDQLNACRDITPFSNREGANEGNNAEKDLDSEEERWKASAELIRKFRESKHPTRRRSQEAFKTPRESCIPVIDTKDILSELLTPRDPASNPTDYDLELEELSFSWEGKNKNKPSSELDPAKLTEMGETIMDENFAFWKKISDCKEALNQLKDNQPTNPDAIRKLLPTQECNTSRVAANIRKTDLSSSTPRLSRTRGTPMTLDPVKNPTPRRPPTPARPSTAAMPTPRPTTARQVQGSLSTARNAGLPSISKTPRGNPRPASAISKSKTNNHRLP